MSDFSQTDLQNDTADDSTEALDPTQNLLNEGADSDTDAATPAPSKYY